MGSITSRKRFLALLLSCLLLTPVLASAEDESPWTLFVVSTDPPVLGLHFQDVSEADSVEVFLDGQPVQARPHRLEFRIHPGQLDSGEHKLVARASQEGRAVERAWSFRIPGAEPEELVLLEPLKPEPIDEGFPLIVTSPDAGQRMGPFFRVKGRTLPGAQVRVLVRRLVDLLPGQVAVEWGRRERTTTANILGLFELVAESPEVPRGVRLEIVVEARLTGQTRSRPVRVGVRSSGVPQP